MTPVTPWKDRLIKPAAFVLCLLPFALLLWDLFHNQLGANPGEKLTHRSGEWALRFLLITLAVAPLRRMTGWHGVLRLRRMLGLYTFFYAVLHFTIWLVFDHFFDLNAIVQDIIKRPYITVGFTAFVLLIPLAATSTNAMMRRLGRRWTTLHQLVYVAATLGVMHYLWLVKADVREPVMYGMILIALLLARVWHQRRPDPPARGTLPPGVKGKNAP